MRRFTKASIASARARILDNRRAGTANRPANSLRAQLAWTTDLLERAVDEVERLKGIRED